MKHANTGLVLTTAAALVYAAVWRRRASLSSDADLRVAAWDKTETLMRAKALPDGASAYASHVVEAKTPPDPLRRWYWWLLATCAYCSEHGEVQVVHEPRDGWAMTKRAAERARDSCFEWFDEDPESCPKAARDAEEFLARHDDDDDEDDGDADVRS